MMDNCNAASPATAAKPVRFWHGDKLVSLDAVPPTLTVLEWLRDGVACSSVKEGCAEGDCGACTVAVARRDGAGEVLIEAVNACIQFVPTLDGKALFTAQDIAPGGSLHPVQQALVDEHGSQCGFCTPGFVMSLYALYENKRCAQDRCVSRAEALDAVSGNLCRCTGYRPIIDAAETMCEQNWTGVDREALRLRLEHLSSTEDAVHAGGSAQAYPGHGEGRFWAPRTLASFAALRAAHPESRIVAGSTDVGLWVTKQHRRLDDVLWLGAVAELDRVEMVADDHASAVWNEAVQSLEIGAAVSVSRAWDALRPHLPGCVEYLDRFASRPVRNAATLVGNLANASPIGDGAPMLIALGASVVLHRDGSERVLALEDLYLGYQKTAMLPGEFVRAVRVPLPGADVRVNAWKVSKRFEQDITAVAVVTALKLHDGVIADARIGVGGMAAIPSRARGTESALRGAAAPATRDAAASVEVRAAMTAIQNEFTPLDDLRASAAYRSEVAANLLLRSWLELANAGPAPAAGKAPLKLSSLQPIMLEVSA